MITSAALCPWPPLLVRELTGADPVLPELRAACAEAVAELLRLVALPESFAARYPSQLSGGQRQRVSIARALALRPKLIVADEATSALDVLVQQQIVELLSQLRLDFGIALLFVSHNLAVTRQVCERISVMYKGEIVESGISDDVILHPKDTYTKKLIRSVPVIV